MDCTTNLGSFSIWGYGIRQRWLLELLWWIVYCVLCLREGCETSIGRLTQVVDAMAVEMHAGLASEGGSKLKMLITYIDSLPDG